MLCLRRRIAADGARSARRIRLLINFDTDNPNTPAIPTWPAYDAKTRATRIIDNETRVENDPDSEMRQLWEKVPG